MHTLVHLQIIQLENTTDYVQFYQQSNGNVEIIDIVVGSERRKGRGKELLKILLEECKQLSTRCLLVFAVTRFSNSGAQNFYEACGFRIVGRLDKFYHDDWPDRPTTFENALMYGYDL